MGEILEMNGERYLPWMPLREWGAIHLDHWGRYYFVEQIAAGKIILDLASGEGYGSLLLADKADKVVGIDIDEKAVEFARNKYKKGNLEFFQGNGCKIPLNGEKIFDIICSFETIEHIGEQEQVSVLNEFARLIKDDGILVISTPNNKYTHSILNYDNPYHKKEMTFEEFKRLLLEKFPYLMFFEQKNYYQNQITELNANEGTYRETVLVSGNKPEEMLSKVGADQKIPQNYICAASKSDFKKKLSAVFTTDADNLIINDIHTRTQEQILEVQIQLAETQAEFEKTRSMLAAKLLDKQKEIENLHQSTSWKITKPVRFLKQIISKK